MRRLIHKVGHEEQRLYSLSLQLTKPRFSLKGCQWIDEKIVEEKACPLLFFNPFSGHLKMFFLDNLQAQFPTFPIGYYSRSGKHKRTHHKQGLIFKASKPFPFERVINIVILAFLYLDLWCIELNLVRGRYFGLCLEDNSSNISVIGYSRPLTILAKLFDEWEISEFSETRSIIDYCYVKI